jgi:Protein of unknown function (DUF3460)
MYESDVTQFLKKFLQDHPEVNEQRATLRATWWDKKLVEEEQSGFRAAQVNKKGYEYFPVPDTDRS